MRSKVRASEVRSGDMYHSPSGGQSKVEGEPLRDGNEVMIFTKFRCEIHRADDQIDVGRKA